MGNTDSGTAKELADLCRLAEATGADSLWAVDHLFWPHPISEPLTTLAVAATATSRATLGTCVLQLPLRQPAAVAKQATALQRLCDGRFVLGLGVGSHPDEYHRAGADFRRRGRSMDVAVASLREAWSEPDAPVDPAPRRARARTSKNPGRAGCLSGSAGTALPPFGAPLGWATDGCPSS